MVCVWRVMVCARCVPGNGMRVACDGICVAFTR